MKNIVFFHPLPISSAGNSGSRVRPFRMRNAFQQLGYSVTEVVGEYQERKEIIRNQVLGKRFLFCYGESANMPFLLTNRHRFPTLLGYDQKMFRFLSKSRVPIGIFFRDIYWTNKEFVRTESLHRRMYLPLWIHELSVYRKYCTKLFMPTMDMARKIPIKWKEDNILSLPPGCEQGKIECYGQKRNSRLKLLYVGNIAPPLYDMRELFGLFRSRPDMAIDVICRENDWNKHKHLYQSSLSDNVKIHHRSGAELLPFYRDSDVFITYRQHHPYLDITLPIKIHEAWSFGLPVILKSGGVDAKWVARVNGGWIVDDNQELSCLLTQLSSDENMILAKRQDIKNITRAHSWVNRARYVAEILMHNAEIDKTFF